MLIPSVFTSCRAAAVFFSIFLPPWKQLQDVPNPGPFNFTSHLGYVILNILHSCRFYICSAWSESNKYAIVLSANFFGCPNVSPSVARLIICVLFFHNLSLNLFFPSACASFNKSSNAIVFWKRVRRKIYRYTSYCWYENSIGKVFCIDVVIKVIHRATFFHVSVLRFLFGLASRIIYFIPSWIRTSIVSISQLFLPATFLQVFASEVHFKIFYSPFYLSDFISPWLASGIMIWLNLRYCIAVSMMPFNTLLSASIIPWYKLLCFSLSSLKEKLKLKSDIRNCLLHG